MPRKKNKLLKAVEGIAKSAVSDISNQAIGMIPNGSVRKVAHQAANAVGSAITGGKKKRGKGRTSSRGGAVQAQIAPQTVGFAQAPTAFGATVSNNYFVTKQIGKDTLRVWGKVQFVQKIGQNGPDALANDSAFVAPANIPNFIFNPLNAASDDVESRLGKTAQTYKSFAWRELNFEYVPSVGTGTKGQFALSVSWDPTQTTPPAAADLLNYEDSMSNSAWKPAMMPVKCPDPGLQEAWCYNQASQATAATIRQNYQCQLMARLVEPNPPGDSETWGTLEMHYVVDFFKPYIDDTELTLMMSMSTRMGRLSPDALCHLRAMLEAVVAERTREVENGSWRTSQWAQVESNLPTVLILGASGERDSNPLELRYRWKILPNGRLKYVGLRSLVDNKDAVPTRELDLYQIKGPSLPHTVISDMNEIFKDRLHDAIAAELRRLGLGGPQNVNSVSGPQTPTGSSNGTTTPRRY